VDDTVKDPAEAVEPVETGPAAEPEPAPRHRGWRPGTLPDRPRLVLASFLMLFIELALIRWTAANVVYLVHLTNFVLLGSFLGIGLGFIRGGTAGAGRGRDLFPFAPVALALLVGFVLVFPVGIATLSGPRPIVGLHGSPAMPRWLSLTLIFALTVVVMGLLASEVARTFGRFAPLEAYRLDIIGSLAGIAGFAAVSWLRLPPLGWAVVALLVLVALLGRRAGRWQWAAVVVVLGLLGGQSILGHDRWSPYYKVRAIQHGDGSLEVTVNNTPHQTAYPLDTINHEAIFYNYPYSQVHDPANVLIIGAGTGNDVAAALAHDAGHVDAVEIDPVLQGLGKDHAPARPYADPRVSVHIDDGRAFIERTRSRYDLIVLALTDSATIVTGQSALRLENYLFTTEALAKDRELLKPGGTFAMYNYYEGWLLDRYAGTVAAVYDHPPCVQLGPPLGGRREAVLTMAKDGTTPGCQTNWVKPAGALSPATDDRPFPYLTQRAIPRFYLVMLGLILLAAVALIRVTAGPIRQMRPYLDLAFMGGAFLLLETKNVVQFALLFGTTWFVNAAVFAGVLLSVLAAVEIARRARLPRPVVLYALLLVALAISWLVPASALLDLAVVPRFLLAVAVAFLPILLANLVFAQRFAAAGSTLAFGANLLGAMIGGALEYLALITGYHFLLVVVAVLYGLAFLTGRRHLAAAA
jgi:spermidine synthase